jgi:hypothetical protein
VARSDISLPTCQSTLARISSGCGAAVTGAGSLRGSFTTSAIPLNTHVRSRPCHCMARRARQPSMPRGSGRCNASLPPFRSLPRDPAIRVRQCGRFDQRAFPAASHDVDWCLRARRRGLRIVWTPFASLTSPEDFARRASPAASRAAGRRLRTRWADQLAADSFGNPFWYPKGMVRRCRRVPPGRDEACRVEARMTRPFSPSVLTGNISSPYRGGYP